MAAKLIYLMKLLEKESKHQRLRSQIFSKQINSKNNFAT